jgi:hypothetical protein
MAEKPTRVTLFRLVRHLNGPLTQDWLERAGVLRGAPQSITKISHAKYESIIANGS